MEQSGIGSRYASSPIDCGQGTTISCNANDCRLIDVTTKEGTVSFFSATLLVCAIGGSTCEVKDNSRGPNKEKYVLLHGSLACTKDYLASRKIAIYTDDPNTLKDSIVGQICECTQVIP